MHDVDFSRFEVVSFDIFDTLLHRLVLAPVDVFELIQLRAFEDPRSLLNSKYLDGFAQARMRAEAAARAHRITEHGGEGEITFDEIYDQWMQETGAARELADWLKALELDCEARLLHASTEGKTIYDAARATGSTILLISDMYLPSDFLRNVLVSQGFEGAADIPLYVSGEVRLSKHMGTLYGHVGQAEGQTVGTHWLHVGDNSHGDVAKAREAGLSAYHATWAKIRNVQTVRSAAHGCGSFVQSLVTAMKEPHACSRMPQDPLERIGYQVWGPMLFGFVCWLLSEFKQKKIQHVVFVARDGWLMSKLMLRCLENLPDLNWTSEYLYMSRKTGYKTGVRDWHPERARYYVSGKSQTSAKRVFAAAGIQAKDFLGVLQSCGINDIDAILLKEQDKKSVVQALNAAHMDILRQNAAMRKTFGSFYDNAMEGRSRVALVDIGWVGNIQRCFMQSLRDPATSDRVFGYYLGLHRDHISLNAELNMAMQGWLNNSDRYEELNHALMSGGVELLEFILTAPHGSTIDLEVGEKGILPVLEKQEEQEKASQALAARAQAGVVRFVEDHAFLLEWLSPETLANPAWADAFLHLVTDPDDEALQCLAGITHSDGPGSNDVRLVLASKLEGEAASNLKQWEKARADAFWIFAYDKLNPKPKRYGIFDQVASVLKRRYG